MKKFCFILSVILASALFGCRKDVPQYAFFLYDGNDTFITEMMEYMVSILPPDMSYEVFDASNSQSVQNQQIVKTIENSYDMLIVNAVDRLACGSIAEKCAVSGVPVIFFNREPLEGALAWDDVFYVGAAADSLGVKQAEMVSDLFKSNGKYDKNDDGRVQLIILKGEQGHQDAEKRTENCVNHLKNLGFTVDILETYVADWRRSDAKEGMDILYGQYGERIELIFANNDDMALGAIDYLTEAGIFSAEAEEQPFIIVGVDGTKGGLEATREGLMYGTVNNDFRKQSRAITELAGYIIGGRSLVDFPYTVTNRNYLYIDGDIITKENIKD